MSSRIEVTVIVADGEVPAARAELEFEFVEAGF